jgi:prepilin-type N-terminal cleavage/methylation domain-containing protein
MRAFQQRRRGFTLIEILIVTGIIGILVTIAVPSFVRARENARAKTCTQNLRAIEAAKDQYLMDNNQPRTASISDANIIGPSLYIRTTPECPSLGAYTVGSGDVTAVCSVGAPHAL